jgi:hypothetical protein
MSLALIGNIHHDTHCGPIRFGYRRILMKNCARCQGRFDRIPAKVQRLKDGSRLDLNTVCPSCEVILVKEAAERALQPPPPSSEELAKWERECLRKNAFTSAHLARNVAKRMRQRHKGTHHPVDVYKCQVVIDPVLYPERAQLHWHIGGNEKP